MSKEDVDAIRRVLANNAAVESAILYGSRAMATHRQGSDIDLTLVGDKLTHSDLLEIDIALDDLLLPYKIDLNLYKEIDNEPLRKHIAEKGKPLYTNTDH